MNGIFQNMFKFILEGLDDCVEVWRCKEAQFSTKILILCVQLSVVLGDMPSPCPPRQV